MAAFPEGLPEISVHVVWNPKVKLNLAEEALLEMPLTQIRETPIEERTYI